MYDVILFTDVTNPIFRSIQPLGAYKLAHILRKNGYKVLVLNHISEFSIIELKRFIDLSIGDNTKLVGFSTTFITNLDPDQPERSLTTGSVVARGKTVEDELVTYIKSKNNNIKFAVGGATSSRYYNNPNIDYIFVGYSESSIIDLMNHLDNGADIPNSQVSEYGHVVIDDRTAPKYNFVTDKMFWEDIDVVNTRVLPIEISRGCIFKCKFCAYPLNGKKKLDYIKNPDVLYEELLESYTKHNIDHFYIVDDTFNDSVEKLIQVRDAIKRLPFQPKFWCFARLDLICSKPEMLPLMHEIGIRALFFGIETMNHETGKIIGKGMQREKQVEMLHHIKQSYPDISTHGSFIMGLPGESIESMTTTIDQLKNGEIPLDNWVVGPLRIHPNTVMPFVSDIEINYEKYGYEIVESHPDGTIEWKTDITSYSEVEKMCIDANKQSFDSYMPALSTIAFVSFGYDVSFVKNSRIKDFPWEELNKQRLPLFIEEYKSQLISMLTEERQFR